VQLPPEAFMDNIEKANKVFLENFPPETNFERAVFFSWYCGIRDCKYCYMSTQKENKLAKRTDASIVAEVIVCKELMWDIGFISGGKDAFKSEDFLNLLKKINIALNDKVWINIGALNEEELILFKPYIKGVIGAIETLNPKLHDELCPSKPIAPFVNMFKLADKHNLMKGMTLIVGLGETIDDFLLLEKFIRENGISKIHIYSLNPQKGTMFENTKSPEPEYHAEWIARTRIAFPKIDIQAGIWSDRVKTISLLLKAGANSISKFPAIRQFNSKDAQEIEKQAELAGRKFKGTLTKLPQIDIGKLPFEGKFKEQVEIRLQNYITQLKKRAI
jgi:biotin synthase-like enzyme